MRRPTSSYSQVISTPALAESNGHAASSRSRQFLYVPGNHEFYGRDLQQTLSELQKAGRRFAGIFVHLPWIFLVPRPLFDA